MIQAASHRGGTHPMKVLFYQDDTLDLNLDGLVTGLNSAGDGRINFRQGSARFQISGSSIRYSGTYQQLSKSFVKEAQRADLTICFTKIPYDNNYFFHGQGNLIIISFYSWEQLTRLPIENGAVYFLVSVLRFRLPFPTAHRDVTGCINDFLWDKSGIDSGMRSGLVCDACTRQIDDQNLTVNDYKLLDVLRVFLNDLGLASRNDENVVDYWKRLNDVRTAKASDRFAVFLCHNVQDKADVRIIRRKLEALGIRTWFDEEQLRPGMAWQVVLEEQIAAIESAAIFVGRSGIGPWQSVEMRAFLSEFVRRRCPVIPVILASAKDIPELPIFLRQLTWVDFRETPDDALSRLVWGITGKRTDKIAKPVRAKRRIKEPKRVVVKSNGNAGKPRLS